MKIYAFLLILIAFCYGQSTPIFSAVGSTHNAPIFQFPIFDIFNQCTQNATNVAAAIVPFTPPRTGLYDVETIFSFANSFDFPLLLVFNQSPTNTLCNFIYNCGRGSQYSNCPIYLNGNSNYYFAVINKVIEEYYDYDVNFALQIYYVESSPLQQVGLWTYPYSSYISACSEIDNTTFYSFAVHDFSIETAGTYDLQAFYYQFSSYYYEDQHLLLLNYTTSLEGLVVNGCSLPFIAIPFEYSDGSLRSVNLSPGNYTLVMGFLSMNFTNSTSGNGTEPEVIVGVLVTSTSTYYAPYYSSWTEPKATSYEGEQVTCTRGGFARYYYTKTFVAQYSNYLAFDLEPYLGLYYSKLFLYSGDRSTTLNGCNGLIAAESDPYMVVGSKSLIVGNTYTLVASTDFSDYPFFLFLIGGPVVGSNFHFPRPTAAPLTSGSSNSLLYLEVESFEPVKRTPVGAIVAAVLGTIVGVLLIGLVVGFVAYYSIKKKRQEARATVYLPQVD